MGEPFIFADRGAWFDGKYDMMTFELLKLPEIVIHGFWTKVHSQGVLFSANRIHGDFNTDRNDTGDFWNQRDDNGYYLGVNDSLSNTLAANPQTTKDPNSEPSTTSAGHT